MYTDKIKKLGEHHSVAEELLNEVPELEQKCSAVDKSVREGYFTIDEALRNYKVSEIEFISYVLLKNNLKLKRINKQEQLFDTINTVVSIFKTSSDSFDSEGQKALAKIKKISEQVVANEKLLVR